MSTTKLYRSQKNKVIAGVCGGLAEYNQWDPSITRLIAAGITILTGFGPGIILYLIAWIIIPKNPKQSSNQDTFAEEIIKKIQLDHSTRKKTKIQKLKPKKQENKIEQSKPNYVLGIILILLGAALLSENIFPWFNLSWTWKLWPLFIIVWGISMLTKKKGDENV